MSPIDRARTAWRNLALVPRAELADSLGFPNLDVGVLFDELLAEVRDRLLLALTEDGFSVEAYRDAVLKRQAAEAAPPSSIFRGSSGGTIGYIPARNAGGIYLDDAGNVVGGVRIDEQGREYRWGTAAESSQTLIDTLKPLVDELKQTNFLLSEILTEMRNRTNRT